MARKKKLAGTGFSSLLGQKGTGRILRVCVRECRLLWANPIYLFCLVLFPLFITFFFTSMMGQGSPTNLPCGVVDQDNTPMTRAITRRLDSFQGVAVAARYPTVSEARRAIQRGEIYGFLYFPEHTTADLLAQRQPTVSFYYNSISMLAGSTLMRDMKTVTTLASAAVGSAKLSALGKSDTEIRAFLQPVAIDLHMVGNPWANYNAYLTTFLVPGILMLFMFLITAYSIGTELKFQRARDWMQQSGGNITIALLGKMLPQFLVSITIMLAFYGYTLGHLGFPYACSPWRVLSLALLTVVSSEGFGIFIFALLPSLRMSMSVCSLWAVLGFSIGGATYPVFAMHPIIESLSWLFPLRHYYMIYQKTIFNGYPLTDAWIHILILTVIAILPWFVKGRIRKAMMEYVYIP